MEIYHFFMKKIKNTFRILLVALLCFGSYSFAHAQTKKPLYSLDRMISLQGNNRYDYLFVNPKTQKLYVTHGDRLDVINATTNTRIGAIKKLGEIHGVAIDNKLHRGFVSDNKNRSVDVFKPGPLKLIKKVHLKGKDQDCTILDPVSGKIFVYEGDSRQVVVVNPKTMKEVKVIPLGGKPEFAVSNGKGLIFNNLEDKGKVAVIDVHKMKVIKKYDLSEYG